MTKKIKAYTGSRALPRVLWMAILGCAPIVFFMSCLSTRKLADAEARKALLLVERSPTESIITDEDLEGLPLPVSRYLRKAGVIGKERLRTFRGRFRGRMKLKDGGGWVPVRVTQYSFMEPSMVRIFYIKARMFGILPFVGRDRYAWGKGNMLIRILDMFTVVNQTGSAMDRSALVTYLNDMSMFPMAMIDKRVSWEALDDRSARATLTDSGLSVSGTFFFDENDRLVNFYTDDRTYDDGRGDVRIARWWTPFRGTQVMNGVTVPLEGDAIWEFPDGRRFHYAAFKLQTIEYNALELYRK